MNDIEAAIAAFFITPLFITIPCLTNENYDCSILCVATNLLD